MYEQLFFKYKHRDPQADIYRKDKQKVMKDVIYKFGQ